MGDDSWEPDLSARDDESCATVSAGESDYHEEMASDVDVSGALADERASLLEEVHLGEVFFYVTVRGGHWLAATRGKITDQARGQARGGLVHDWCEAFDFPVTKDYSLQKYTRRGAVALAT